MKVRLHPILIPVFLFLLVSGNVSIYTLIFVSLLIHEAGHLVAAKMVGLRVRSCTIMPYGGELTIPGRHAVRRRKRFYVALGGPAATLFLLILAMVIPFSATDLLIRIQLILLAVNLLPFLPLDGGQALSAFIEKKGKEYEARLAMIVHSMIFYSIVIITLSFSLPQTIPYIVLASFLLIQNISAFRYRKYEKALFNLKK
ncbi:M50 family metallopeptidase [Sporosarcina ureilytica]|uniref:Peptidase M50 domain-containing protein n=1 Tax=Sporosarcina ureilytica TaxID=298596 RepID=A0A1D8JFX1_9BACL|nr:M50 family metallopeptidase [Sporosarcina ureilytica]AOV07611.1 hypothetical protein BI350_08740 [Sporosarcina ureilytica]